MSRFFLVNPTQTAQPIPIPEQMISMILFRESKTQLTDINQVIDWLFIWQFVSKGTYNVSCQYYFININE